jgi:hypothetical protein
VLSGSSVLTFWDNLTDPSSRVRKSKKKIFWTSWPLRIGLIGCRETSVQKSFIIGLLDL